MIKNIAKTVNFYHSEALVAVKKYYIKGFCIITRGHDGRRFSKTARARMGGNSVSPPPAADIPPLQRRMMGFF